MPSLAPRLVVSQRNRAGGTWFRKWYGVDSIELLLLPVNLLPFPVFLLFLYFIPDNRTPSCNVKKKLRK